MIATTRRCRMEVGEPGIFSERELTTAQQLCCLCSHCGVGAVLLAHCPWESQLQGQVVPGSLAGVPPPSLLKIRIRSRPPDSAPCQPFHKNSSWMCFVSCGQALVTTPPGTTKESFVGSRLQLTACGWLDSLALSPLDGTPSPDSHLFS